MMVKAKEDGQKAVALTDHGNMFGAFKFVNEAKKNGVLPIVGCEFYLVDDRHIKAFSKSAGTKDKRYHQLMLAKDEVGYQNLSKLCSLGYTEGLYSKWPRIDKSLIEKYHEGLIATSCCLGAEIPQAILHGNLARAEERLKWWLDLFGEDFYIELQRHKGLENIDNTGMSQEDINQQLLVFAKKYNIKVIATNDAHYLDRDDSPEHDILLCVNTGSHLEDENRFKFSSNDYFFKTQKEMSQLFKDIPEAIDNTMDIVGKITELDLAREVVLPRFDLPQGYTDQDHYLRALTYAGAKKRYGELNELLTGRIDFELETIKKSGYPGYFLIVQDFIAEARKQGVSVGPGRGSAAGSVVAYCLQITNIDPIKYDLLFERFLNPERVSMPDIDIDFDDEGRSKVIDYVINKYGKDQVAQIITYGTMAAKSSIKDVGRAMNVPLGEVINVTKTFPTHLGATLKAVLAEKDIDKKLKSELNADDVEKAYKFRKLAEGKNDIGEMIRSAKKLEGSVRNTGIHACGVIITPDEMTKYVPVSTAKDSDLQVSQFDNNVVEDAGLLKMDFLGLKTLTIIRDAITLVKERHDVDLDPDEFPLEDEKTYELFQRGETIGIFQYESPGMQKHLKDLQPDAFEDLIAMNALYRPGPMQYIPNFVKRKHGREKITYDLPDMQEYLEETYGITVYQEQVMLLSQKLGGFSKGKADVLRKAMGKKKRKLIDEMYPEFLEGAIANGHDEETIAKIWGDWEKFASYAFNKSHSTCYALIAFQTAYLKAHYPHEYMAAVLNHNKSNTDKLNFFLRECKRMGITVLGPDVNESQIKFNVNDKNEIRFGLSALKGVGEGPVQALKSEIKENGKVTDIFDLTMRVDLRSVNKKCLESLAYGGAFDSFGDVSRATYFAPTEKFNTLIEQALRFGNLYQSNLASNQSSLFGEVEDNGIEVPTIRPIPEWNKLEKLNKEKDVAGIYISGHPLDDYRVEFENYIDCPIDKVESTRNKMVKFAGLVVASREGQNQKGNKFVRATLQDYTGSMDLGCYREDYNKYAHLLKLGEVLYIEGMMKQGWGNSENYYFTLKDVKLLETIGKQLTKSITINLPIQKVSSELVHKLLGFCDQASGEHTLKIIVEDFKNPDQLIKLPLISHNKKVNANGDFIRLIKEIGLNYKLN
jgi:DNA polymerase-3 subunit alpha